MPVVREVLREGRKSKIEWLENGQKERISQITRRTGNFASTL